MIVWKKNVRRYLGLNADTFKDFRYVFIESKNGDLIRIDDKGMVVLLSNTCDLDPLTKGKTVMDQDIKLVVGGTFKFETDGGRNVDVNIASIATVDIYFKQGNPTNSNVVDRFYKEYKDDESTDIETKETKVSKKRRPTEPFYTSVSKRD